MASGWLTDRVCVVGTKVGIVVSKGSPEVTWFMGIDDAVDMTTTLMDAIDMAQRNRERGTDSIEDRTLAFIRCAKK